MQDNIYKKSISYLESKKIFIRKRYTSKIKEYSDNFNILVIEWQRRVWKSYSIIWFLHEHNIDLENIFYVNKELDINDEIQNQKDLNLLFDDINKQKDIKYIIIDEIQNIDSWEKFILWVYTQKKYKIIITWSNSKLLSSELSTFLTWRYLTLNILPFDYKEFLEFNNLESNKDSFREYVTYWWMPEVLMLKQLELKNNYILNTLNSILLKDIVERYWIKNIKLLEKILQFMQSETWNIISITNIWNYITNVFKKEVSLTTISNYIKYLTYPYIINEVSRYDIKWKKILDYTAKYYFTDIWIRNVNWFNFAFDIWKILENIVYINLISQWYKVYVWELNWKEIDFIAEKSWEKLYIQVCYLLSSKDVINREFWNLLSINDNYEKIVISFDESFWNTFEWVKHFNILEWLIIRK